MKINEVIVEGVLDYAKGLLKTRSLAGAKSANQQAQGKKQFDEYLGKVVQKWNEYTGGTGDTDVVKWASNFFDGNLSAIPRPANSNPDTITKYLADVTVQIWATNNRSREISTKRQYTNYRSIYCNNWCIR